MPTPLSERAYARPELLAETSWLADRLTDPNIRIVDARSKDEYEAGHIAGAVNMDGFGSNIPRAENGDMTLCRGLRVACFHDAPDVFWCEELGDRRCTGNQSQMAVRVGLIPPQCNQ